MNKQIFLFGLLLLLGCKKSPQIPNEFNSYIEAKQIVRSADLSIQEEAETDGRSANN